jgi:hypothetical protein
MRTYHLSLEQINQLTARQFNQLLNDIGFVHTYEQTGKIESAFTPEEIAAEEFDKLTKDGRW